MTERKAILVMGAGDATGGAIAKRFAREGYVACVARRNADQLTSLVDDISAAGGTARAFGCDARVEEQVLELFATIEREVGPLEVVVFNIGANVRFSITETTERVYRKVWEMAALAGFLTGREAARHLIANGGGSIFFTGATASTRGGKGYAAFASAKAGLRLLAQSMARELGPQNIHVAHLVIDAGVDTDFVRQRYAERGITEIPEGALMNPASIAETYWQLHRQPRDAWTHELDLRPHGETW